MSDYKEKTGVLLGGGPPVGWWVEVASSPNREGGALHYA